VYVFFSVCFRNHYTASVKFHFLYYPPYFKRLLVNTTVKLVTLFALLL
jgi:hypothetical protein